MNKPKVALIPGSFDPFTVGHAEIVKRALSVFDKVTVAVMINSEKNYMFSPEERCEIVRRSIGNLPNVDVIFDGGMLYKLFDKIGADAIVKGIRNAEDLEYENCLADYNLAHNPKAQTVYIPADECFSNISSSAFKRAVAENSPLDSYICEGALDLVRRIVEGK